MITHDDADELLTEAQVATLAGVAARTVASWRQRGMGPRYLRLTAHTLRYRRADVLAWLAEREGRAA
jgi:predicted DNA-binding transcriptional regulator AlpA